MARTKEITMGYARTMSDGNYGSMKIELSETVVLSPGDSLEDVSSRLVSRIKNRYLKIKKEVAKNG